MSVHKSVLLRYGLGGRTAHGIKCTHDARAQSEAHTALYPVTIKQARVSGETFSNLKELENERLSPKVDLALQLKPTSWEGRVGGGSAGEERSGR